MSTEPLPPGPPSGQIAPALKTYVRQERAEGPSMPELTGPHYARFWRRFAAVVIDGLIVGITFWLVGAFLDFGGLGWVTDSLVDVDGLEGTSMLFLSGIPVQESLLGLIGGWLYHAGLQSSSWQATPGKRAVGILVTDVAGDRISFARATGRHFAEYLSGFLMAGYLIQPFTEKRQALHDLIAGTVVVRR